MFKHVFYGRIAAFSVGAACAALSAVGAYEMQLKQEGGTLNYLVVAAPLVAVCAALVPVLAEREAHRMRALLWWLVCLPAAAAVVFFGAAERVHLSKAAGQSERDALRGAVVRAETALKEAKAETLKARQQADKVKGWKQCGDVCRAAQIAYDARKVEQEAAEKALQQAQSKAVTEASLTAPVWLLPAALDLLAFTGIWAGLSGPWFVRKPAKVEASAKGKGKRKSKGKRSPVQVAKAKAKRTANDNVCTLPVA